MRRALIWAGAIIAGLALGVVAALWSISAQADRPGAIVGAWRVDTGLANAAPLPGGTALALPAREGRAYVRDRDEHGDPLDESCIYELAGRPIPARWWSATVYGRDGGFASNSDHAFSVNSERLGAVRRAWAARVSPVRGEAQYWLSSRSAGREFQVVLRVYHANRGYEAVEAALPSLTRVSCGDGR